MFHDDDGVFLACRGWGGGRFDDEFSAQTLFLKWRSARADQFHLKKKTGQDQSTLARRTETTVTVAECP